MLDHVINYVRSQPWAMTPDKIAALEELLRVRLRGERFTPAEIEERVGAKAERPEPVRFAAFDPDGEMVLQAASGGQNAGRPVVALIGVYGVLAHRAGSMSEMSGGTSTERLAAAVKASRTDAGIAGLVIDIDSPGGAVEGVTELAAEIRETRKVKPVAAVINARAESGGYWIASAADYVAAIPSARAGSIGVYMVHVDESEARAKMGVKADVIADTVTSKHKAEGLVGPLDDDARAHVLGMVNYYADMFAADVARGRGVSKDEVRRKYGRGRSMTAADALAAGMIDHVSATALDDTIRRMAKGSIPRRAEQALAEGDGFKALEGETVQLHGILPLDLE